MSEVEIQLMGSFSVLVHSVEVEESGWARKKAKTLVKLLALAPQRRIHREKAAEVLWPEMELDSAIANLHKAMHSARRAFEPNLRQGAASRFLFSRDGQIWLAGEPELGIDLDRFQQEATAALKSDSLAVCESALALYTRDVLEEDLYEDFCSMPRERARSLCQRLLERVSQQQEISGSPALAETLERLLSFNPVNEDARRRLMRLYVQNGQRHLALEQYRLCSEALKEELDTEPEPETRALFEQILSGDLGERLPSLPANRPLGVKAKAPTRSVRRRVFWALGGFAAAGAIGLVWRNYESPPKSSPPKPRSLAILPLRAPQSAEETILAEGVTEGLINSTSRLPKLRVMARATVFSYQGRSDALAIGRELKVGLVVNGRLVKEGSGYRVSLELIDVSDGARVWGRQFFCQAGEVQNLQRTLNSELAAVLEPPVSRIPQAAPSKHSPSAAAYQLYLNGRYFANQRSSEGLGKARTYLEQAIQLDPDYALAHAGLADSLGLLGVNVANAKELMPQAKVSAERALQLDSSLAEAHTSLGMVYALYEWNWQKAEDEFRQAIGLNEGYATAHHWYGVNLAGMGRFAEAEVELSKALDLDPLSPIIQLNRGYPLYFQRRYAEALRFYNKALELKPDFQSALEDRAVLEHLQGQQEQAAETMRRLLQIRGTDNWEAGFARTYKSAGYQAAMRYLLEANEEKVQAQHVSPVYIASLAIRANDRPKTYFWLEKAFQQRAALLTYIGVDPIYSGIRAELSFRNLAQRIGLVVI